MEESDINIEDSLRSLLRGVRRILSLKWYLLGLTVLAIGCAYCIYKVQPFEYRAESKIYIDSGRSSFKGGGISSLASRFAGGGDSFSEDFILSIAESRLILYPVLYGKLEDGSLLINRLINGADSKIQERAESLFGVDLITEQNSINELTVDQRSLVKTILSQILSENLAIEEGEKGIIVVSVESWDEELSKVFCDTFLEELQSFFIEKVTAKERISFQQVSLRMDSVKNELYDMEIRLAKLKDQKRNLVKTLNMVEEWRLQREFEITNSLYIETIKRKELLKYNLMEETPVIEIIESPILPLEMVKVSLIKLIAILTVTFNLIFLLIYFWKTSISQYIKKLDA